MSTEKPVALKKYVVKKETGSRYARVVHVATGETVKRFDVLRDNGWADADRHCAALNNESEALGGKEA